MLDDKVISNIINIIKSSVSPDRIYIFGSYAYGKPGENSDLDILVIKNSIMDKKGELIKIKKAVRL